MLFYLYLILHKIGLTVQANKIQHIRVQAHKIRRLTAPYLMCLYSIHIPSICIIDKVPFKSRVYGNNSYILLST